VVYFRQVKREKGKKGENLPSRLKKYGWVKERGRLEFGPGGVIRVK